jgi:hypothetical protein
MKLNLTHELPASAEEVWNLVFTDEFMNALDERTGVQRELLSDDVRDGKRHITIQISHSEPLPNLAAKAMGSKTLVYLQDQIIDNAQKTVHWRVRLPSLGSKVQASGTYALEDRAEQCVRVVRGDVQVRVPFVGGKIERQIINKLSGSYDNSAVFICRWLSGQT